MSRKRRNWYQNEVDKEIKGSWFSSISGNIIVFNILVW